MFLSSMTDFVCRLFVGVICGLLVILMVVSRKCPVMYGGLFVISIVMKFGYIPGWFPRWCKWFPFVGTSLLLMKRMLSIFLRVVA